MTRPQSSKVGTFNGTSDIGEISTVKRSTGSRRKKIKIFLMPIWIAVLVAFIIVFVAYLTKDQELSKEDVCTSEGCIDTANTFFKIMDRQKDPCVDFYAYACGNYAQEYPILTGQSGRSFWIDANRRITSFIAQIFQKPNSTTSSNALAKARALHASCMDTELLNNLGFQPLYELLKKVGLPKFPTEDALSEFNLGKTLGRIKRYLNSDVLVELSIVKGILRQGEANDTFILQLSPDTDSKSSENIKAGDKRFMAQVTKLLLNDLQLGDNSTTGNQTEMIAEILKIPEFTSNFNKVINERGNNTNSESMTFDELETMLGNVNQNDSLGTKILLKDYVNEIFSGDIGNWTYDYKNDLISVRTPGVFKNLWAFLNSQKSITILRYVWWAVVVEFAKYTTEEMYETYLVWLNMKGVSREWNCNREIQIVHPLTIVNEVKAIFDFGNQTQKVKEMLNNIKAEFENLVNAADWIDHNTKLNNIDRAKLTATFIGYWEETLNTTILDNYYSDLKMYKEEYLMNRARTKEWEVLIWIKKLRQTNVSIPKQLDRAKSPIDVNAYYSWEKIAIYVPAGILQRPFFFRGLESLNYGALGSILGHEQTHGFITTINIDKNGKFLKGFPPQSTMDHSQKEMQCLIDQYSAFDYSKKEKLNGGITLAENFADNGGLRLSYNAYQTFVKKRGKELKLPGFEDFSHEQLFFLSFATIKCGASAGKYDSEKQKSKHSPGRAHVLGTLQNMKEFSQAFQCPSGSFMNPSKKCIIW